MTSADNHHLSGQKESAATAADRSSSPNRFASSPCSMPEIELIETPVLTRRELISLLNELLEGEHAGVSGTLQIRSDVSDPLIYKALHGIAVDEAKCFDMLVGHVKRLGGHPSSAIGLFYDKLVAQNTLTGQIRLLCKGQQWVVRKLNDVLPRIGDQRLFKDLQEMRRIHEINVELCNDLPL